MITTKKMITIICHVLLILTCTQSWAGYMFFTDYPVRELKVLEVDEETQTVVFESPDGIAFTLTVGDMIGEETTMIIEINKLMITVEEAPDETGRIMTNGIPVIPIEPPVLLEM